MRDWDAERDPVFMTAREWDEEGGGIVHSRRLADSEDTS
jgi:hypothetical protein